MEFDISNVYTRKNADELCKGDIVCVANTKTGLKEAVENDETVILEEIGKVDVPIARFWAVASPYFFAYLVCPARNAKAYRGWEDGKTVEMQLEPNGRWRIITDDEIKSTKDFWFHYAIRVKE